MGSQCDHSRPKGPRLSDVTTEWRVEEHRIDQSIVHIRFAAEISDPGMTEMLTQRVGDGMQPLLGELKFFAENGQPRVDV